MPWGTSLNKDVDDCVARHVAVRYGLKEGDNGYSTRFFRRTLREQTSAYKRAMDPALGIEKGAPTSNRICQDIRKFILALTGVRDARGICVQGLGLGRVTAQPPQMARCSVEASARRRFQQKTPGSTLTWRRRDCG